MGQLQQEQYGTSVDQSRNCLSESFLQQNFTLKLFKHLYSTKSETPKSPVLRVSLKISATTRFVFQTKSCFIILIKMIYVLNERLKSLDPKLQISRMALPCVICNFQFTQANPKYHVVSPCEMAMTSFGPTLVKSIPLHLLMPIKYRSITVNVK